MKSINLKHYFPIIQNINNIYQKNKSIKSMWKYADKEFLHDLYSYKSMPYHEAVRRYIDLVIQKKLASDTQNSYTLVSGKILALLIDNQLDDGMAEGATQGFFDACNVAPPEFWITFENGILYSFIPNVYVPWAEDGIEVAMGDSLHWVSDVIYFQNISYTKFF